MITVQELFVCKPGNASKLAKLMREWADLEKRRGFDMQVMTDVTGQYHRVIITSTHKNLATWEKNKDTMGDSPAHKKVMAKFKDMNEMYVSGSREIFKVW